ncbi:MAG: hypothetical protein KAR20_12760, partial [Candidatus Heimdallarchaeota archaeon]|nr:hypothetical protein [Candidatus Heimdallarchaeota archaeon]
SALEKLGNCTPLKRWLAASLGLSVKAWLKRAWAFMNTTVSRDKLPNFIFDLSAPQKRKDNKTSKAPKLKPLVKTVTLAEEQIENKADIVEPVPITAHSEMSKQVKDTEIIEEHLENSSLIPSGTTGAVSIEELETLIDKEEEDPATNTITGAMTVQLTHGYITQRILESESLKELSETDEDKHKNHEDAENKQLTKVQLMNEVDAEYPPDTTSDEKVEKTSEVRDAMKISIKKPETFNNSESQVLASENDDKPEISDADIELIKDVSAETKQEPSHDDADNVNITE